eukprot:7127264-Ditylum_brightwellii.AAC.1
MNEVADQSMGPGLICVDFFATWCGPYKALAPIYCMLSLRTPLVKLLKVDIDKVEEIRERFKIQNALWVHLTNAEKQIMEMSTRQNKYTESRYNLSSSPPELSSAAKQIAVSEEQIN